MTIFHRHIHQHQFKVACSVWTDVNDIVNAVEFSLVKNQLKVTVLERQELTHAGEVVDNIQHLRVHGAAQGVDVKFDVVITNQQGDDLYKITFDGLRLEDHQVVLNSTMSVPIGHVLTFEYKQWAKA